MSKENHHCRFKKSSKQVQILTEYYQKHAHWNQNVIKEISNLAHLPKEKIYKWYWDQNKKLKPSVKNEDEVLIEVVCKDGQVSSQTNTIYKCSAIALHQSVSQEFKDRLSLLAMDLLLIE